MQPPRAAAGDDAAAPRQGLRRALAIVVGIAVAAALAWQIHKAIADLRQHSRQVAPDGGWLAAAVGLHAAGLVVLAGPWLLAGPAFGVPASRRSWAVYLASHLGKYVPGKAAVPALRCLLLPSVATGRTVLATVYETCCTMAAAALVAAVALCAWHRELPGPVFLAVALAASGFVALSLPMIFRFAVDLVFRREGDPAKDAPFVPWGRWLLALLSAGGAWIVLSASLWCAIRAAAPDAAPEPAFQSALLAAPLGTVGGFVSMLPGHFGTREWIVSAILAPQVGDFPALAAAAWHRLATLAAEGLLGGALWWALRRGRRRTEP